jgi:AraC family transcriptional regulator of adaptative response/methylated-DNA-[protein]-cysteine methyltransferase
MHYIESHLDDQPTLDAIAAHVHLSPYHFQRLFSRWAGISPKRFLQVLTLQQGRRLLDQQQSLLDASTNLGLSGASRLHDHFVQLDAITPGEYRRQGRDLVIDYGVADTPFGALFMALTQRGVHRACFIEANNIAEPLKTLRDDWPLARLNSNPQRVREIIAQLNQTDSQSHPPLQLHVRGTNFQIAVWRALLTIPPGRRVNYRHIAEAIGQPRASRAVGNANAANPVALLIPCHRVIRQSGALGGYRWGEDRKRLIQIWEQLHMDSGEATWE